MLFRSAAGRRASLSQTFVLLSVDDESTGHGLGFGAGEAKPELSGDLRERLGAITESLDLVAAMPPLDEDGLEKLLRRELARVTDELGGDPESLEIEPALLRWALGESRGGPRSIRRTAERIGRRCLDGMRAGRRGRPTRLTLRAGQPVAEETSR